MHFASYLFVADDGGSILLQNVGVTFYQNTWQFILEESTLLAI
jgi:hypothetical protein